MVDWKEWWKKKRADVMLSHTPVIFRPILSIIPTKYSSILIVSMYISKNLLLFCFFLFFFVSYMYFLLLSSEDRFLSFTKYTLFWKDQPYICVFIESFFFFFKPKNGKKEKFKTENKRQRTNKLFLVVHRINHISSCHSTVSVWFEQKNFHR